LNYQISNKHQKVMKVFPNSILADLASVSSPVFQYVEKKFWDWIDSSNPASEYREMYFGDDAIYTKKGAIVGAIEAALELAVEENKPVSLHDFDYDAVFS
jgi:hypothetical protein